MKPTKKLFAFLLTAALSISMLGTSVATKADTQTATDTVTVTLKVEDVDSTLVSEQITLTKEDVTKINSTFSQDLVSEDFVAAHALAKYVIDVSDSPTDDLAFSYGSPSYIKGEKECDYYPYWSFRVNNQSPADESTGYSYTPDSCPIKNGDSIVFFRQACYDPDAGDWGAYTSYSWFGQDSYETIVNVPVTVTYSIDDGFAAGTLPAAEEEISVYQGSTLVKTVTADQNGTAVLTFDQTGIYTITGHKFYNDIPQNSHASATITVTEAAAPTQPPTAQATQPPTSLATVTPAPSATMPPTVCPSASPKTETKPAAPKKLKASVTKKKVAFSWKKATGADGYELAVSKKNKNRFKKFKSTAKAKLTAKFKTGVFYVKVRSYTKQDGKKVYSKYSNIIKVKIK